VVTPPVWCFRRMFRLRRPRITGVYSLENSCDFHFPATWLKHVLGMISTVTCPSNREGSGQPRGLRAVHFCWCAAPHPRMNARSKTLKSLRGAVVRSSDTIWNSCRFRGVILSPAVFQAERGPRALQHSTVRSLHASLARLDWGCLGMTHEKKRGESN
jgi:hypothetical protein